MDSLFLLPFWHLALIICLIFHVMWLSNITPKYLIEVCRDVYAMCSISFIMSGCEQNKTHLVLEKISKRIRCKSYKIFERFFLGYRKPSLHQRGW